MDRGEFVGRTRERETLDAGLRAALDHIGQVALIAGEPGVGKTRLAQEALGSARELGMITSWGRATEDEGSPPYWPFRQVVRGLMGESFVPHVAGTERFRLFEEITEALTEAARPNGLLVVLDDLHWADPASLQLLAHLAAGMSAARLMVLGTYRDTERTESLRAALAGLAREPHVARMRLTGLTEQEVAAQLEATTGWAVPESVAAAVRKRTQGNPFFVGELGALLADGRDTNGELPDGIRDAVRGRLARRSPDCRAVISAAAVLGSEPEPVGLAAATGRELAGVLAALDEAAEAGILAGQWFAHDLIREAARLEVATAERLALHERMAEHLAGLADADTRVAEIAFHRLESLPAGDPAEAVRWAERAADKAMAQLAWEEAESLYRRALPAATTPHDRCRLLLGRARAQVRTYDMDDARQSVAAVADIARQAGDHAMIAEAVLVMEGTADVTWVDTGRALCDEALAGIPDEDSAIRARLLAQRVVVGAWNAAQDADDRSIEALAMAERVGDRQAIVEALRARQIVRGGPEGAADRLALGDRLLAVADDDAKLWGHLWRFDALCQLGEIDLAEAEVDAITEVAERLRSPLARWHTARSRTAIALARGRFEQARHSADLAMGLAKRAGHEGALIPGVAVLLMLRGLTGDASVITDDMVAEYESKVPALRSIPASWKLAMGQREAALRLYRTLPPPDDVPRFLLLSALAGQAELAAEVGDRAAAEVIYSSMLPHADLFVCGGAGVIAILGSVQLSLGLAAATLGRLDDAVRHLRAAAERNDRAGMPPYATISRYHLAKVLARRKRPGDREESAALATSVAAVAAKLGMAPLRALAEALAEPSASPLTKREREIAVLVSQGLTNKQIAATAHISERTVETHVQNILSKLGFTNRGQIVAWELSTGPTY